MSGQPIPTTQEVRARKSRLPRRAQYCDPCKNKMGGAHHPKLALITRATDLQKCPFKFEKTEHYLKLSEPAASKQSASANASTAAAKSSITESSVHSHRSDSESELVFEDSVEVETPVNDKTNKIDWVCCSCRFAWTGSIVHPRFDSKTVREMAQLERTNHSYKSMMNSWESGDVIPTIFYCECDREKDKQLFADLTKCSMCESEFGRGCRSKQGYEKWAKSTLPKLAKRWVKYQCGPWVDEGENDKRSEDDLFRLRRRETY